MRMVSYAFRIMKGTVGRLVKIIVVSFLILLLIVLCYSVIPTILIRVWGWGITKKVKGKGIVLTFDDGPNPEYTIQLLDLLKKYEVKASFFVVGSKVKSNTDIIKRMYQEGHTIGIHHYHHISSWILTPFQLKKQLKLTEKAIQDCTNGEVMYYRPPWGHFNLFTPLVSKNYHIIMWSNIFGDWKVERSQHTLLNELRTKTEEGSILLLHDCGETLGADQEAPRYMIENLEIFIQESKKQGKRFVNLKDL
jgi:peptidoglycan-N-acetylglucosamine deacetylase